ncbi:MAG: hypothetical protein V3Q69_07050 [Burkholderia sp.]
MQQSVNPLRGGWMRVVEGSIDGGAVCKSEVQHAADELMGWSSVDGVIGFAICDLKI